MRFCSDTSLSVHLEAMISIKSGPTEIVTIDAIADDLKYSLDTTELEFGKQVKSVTITACVVCDHLNGVLNGNIKHKKHAHN